MEGPLPDACVGCMNMSLLAQSSPIISASSRSSSSVNSPAGASPAGSGTGAITTGSVLPAGFPGVEVASSDEIQLDWVFRYSHRTYH